MYRLKIRYLNLIPMMSFRISITLPFCAEYNPLPPQKRGGALGHSQVRVLKWKQRTLWYATAAEITKTAQRMGEIRGRLHVYWVNRAIPEKSTSQYFPPETVGMPASLSL